MVDEVLGVHEFRESLSGVLKRFRGDLDSPPVIVGAYRREEAVLLAAGQYRRLVANMLPAVDDDADLPGIRLQLARTPEERIEGLARAATFFSEARPVT